MPEQPDPLPYLIHERFEVQARQHPDRTALVDGDHEVTFGVLRDRARAVAAGLTASGIRTGSLVGVHLERSASWVVAILGTLMTGAAVVPLPPGDPERRLRDIVAFGKLDGVVDDDETPFNGSDGVAVHRLAALASAEDSPADGSSVVGRGNGLQQHDQAAFVLSSSGSTGKPKLIVRSHRSFFHRLEWTWRTHPFGDDDLGCQKAHATTTHALYELLEPLLAGAPTLVVRDADVHDLERFWHIVRTKAPTRLLIVPSALRATLEFGGLDAPSVRVMVLMGEYVSPDLAQELLAALPASTAVYTIYGSTESSSALVTDIRASFRPGCELPLGVAISEDVRPSVRDEDGGVVELGASGRLYLAGPLLFTGYLGDPEGTERVLAPLPDTGALAYDTRDNVRLTGDGAMEYLGRVDHTVKVRGFRVELPEVERAMASHPGVREAAVVVDEEGAAGAALIGFYTPADVDGDALRKTLAQRLTAYMVPSALVGMDRFPRTSSQKIDRVRLLSDFAAGASTNVAGSPVERAGPDVDDADDSETRRRVVEIWARTLGHRRFADDRSFFEVGGTSLTAFALMHRLREAFGIERERLPEGVLYTFPSVDSLTGEIDRVLAGGAAADAAEQPLLVRLRAGTDPFLPPLFLVASAGGTLGAYEKLAGALESGREVLGIRDPYLWGGRDIEESFDAWIDRYLEAIRARQPAGPYFVCAYSSAGAFGLELAHRLRECGEEVGLLTLVDPLSMDRRDRSRYGYWALEATWSHPLKRMAVKWAGVLRAPFVRAAMAFGRTRRRHGVEPKVIRQVARTFVQNRGHLQNLSALLELNTGLPFTLDASAFDGVPPEASLRVLQERVREVAPEMDPGMVERLVVQYEVQVRTQHAYQLRRYDGPVLLVEPRSAYAGLVPALLRPYLRHLEVRTVGLGTQTPREKELSVRFGGLHTHYRSMRDDTFVRGLAGAMDARLG